MIAFIINGQDEQKKKKYRKNDDKTANLVANYGSVNEMEFLKGIASIISIFFKPIYKWIGEFLPLL